MLQILDARIDGGRRDIVQLAFPAAILRRLEGLDQTRFNLG